ncbi:hypothetical protein BGZ70_004634, partial [Mortierella alpina]
GHTQLVGQLQLSGDNLMTGGGDGFMYLWNLRTFECQYRVQAHDQSVTSLCFDAKRIVTGGNDGAVKLWDRETGKFIRLLTKTDAAIWRVSICEERVVMCMQKNGRTAMEVMCFDSEAPILAEPAASGCSAAEAAAAAASTAAAAAVQQHEVLARGGAGGVHELLSQPGLWSAEGLGHYDDLSMKFGTVTIIAAAAAVASARAGIDWNKVHDNEVRFWRDGKVCGYATVNFQNRVLDMT